MAQSMQMPAIRSAGRQTAKNFYRFYPGRKPRVMANGKTDDRILFESAVYARIQMADTFEAGIVIGPTLDRILDGQREQLLGGSGLVAAKAVQRGDEILSPTVRKYPVPNTRTVKTFMDLVTLKHGPDNTPIVVPIEEDDVVYFDVCTGDPQESEESYISALSGLWYHGSAEYMGAGVAPVINAPSKKRAKKKAVGAEQDPKEVRFNQTSVAQLWGETLGAMVNGVPLWWDRVWKVRFSRDESEVIIVRQQHKYYQLYANGGRGMFRDCSNIPGIEQQYLDNIAKLAKLGVATTPLLVPPSGIVQTSEEAPVANPA